MNRYLIFFFLPLFLSFKFSPMSQSLELGEGKKSAQFIVENETSDKMAIELTVKERVMKEDGKEELPATSLLSVFPPQIIIPPKEKRTIRVMWNGPSDIKTEKAYRVIAEQLPLNVDKKKRGTGIQMLMKYMAAFYVTPEKAESELQASLVSFENNKLVIKVENAGNRHQIIYKPKLTLKNPSSKVVLTSKELKGLGGENVLAKTARIFSVDYKGKIPSSPEVLLKIEE